MHTDFWWIFIPFQKWDQHQKFGIFISSPILIFFSLDSLCNFLSAFFFNQIWHSSCSFQDKWIWRESKGANTQNDNFLTFFYRIPLKNSCLKYGNIFELAFSKILFFYFNRLKVNIGLYVKWIKKNSENMDLI
jgi:hypothetical protein